MKNCALIYLILLPEGVRLGELTGKPDRVMSKVIPSHVYLLILIKLLL